MAFALAWPPKADARFLHGDAPKGASAFLPDPRCFNQICSTASATGTHDRMRADNRLRRLRRRPEFLRVQRNGRRFATPGLVLQACPVPQPASSGATDDIGIGFTASKKVGNAVARNRARRRLKALVREHLPTAAKRGVDYVVIARQGTIARPWPDLQQDLMTALKRLKMQSRERHLANHDRSDQDHGNAARAGQQ